VQKNDHNIGFQGKRHFSPKNWGKIAENCDRNIDTCSHEFRELALATFTEQNIMGGLRFSEFQVSE
jgi:hypothetical protein